MSRDTRFFLALILTLLAWRDPNAFLFLLGIILLTHD